MGDVAQWSSRQSYILEDAGSTPADPLSDQAIAGCVATLEALRARDPDEPARVAVERAAAHLRKSAKRRRRREREQQSHRLDREAAAGSQRAAAYFQSPAADLPAADAPAADPPRRLRNQRRCYICKQPFRELHAFYHALCPGCAARNFAARTDTADLAGRAALVTGGRIKIGFEAALALLGAGAHVTITTRFPRDAADRFAAAVDAGRLPRDAHARLEIAALDFLDVRGVMAWIAARLARGGPLDILINNAAQTVRRPAAYYARLLAGERPPGELPAGPAGPAGPAPDALVTLAFPARTDEEGQPLDLRPRNSWVLGAAEVEPAELAEVHVVNAIVPFLLATRLRPLLARSPFPDRYIVNVSAMEGVFAYANKQPRHPHTNMAKAALNMFTRTSWPDYLRDGIHMNSVDTGWITQENPHPLKRRAEAAGFCPPLDVTDGAARVIAPILRGVRGDRVAGALFKDYEPAAW